MSSAISASGERNAKGLIGTLSLTRSYLNSHFSQFDSNVPATSISTCPSSPVPGKRAVLLNNTSTTNFHLSRFNPSLRLTSSFGIHFTSDIFRNTLLLSQAQERRRQPRSHSNLLRLLDQVRSHRRSTTTFSSTLTTSSIQARPS